MDEITFDTEKIDLNSQAAVKSETTKVHIDLTLESFAKENLNQRSKRNVIFDCLSEQVLNVAHSDHRVIEASKKSLRVKKTGWKMNIVKDIVKSNLKYQPEVNFCKNLRPVLQRISPPEPIKQTNENERITLKKNDSILITVANNVKTFSTNEIDENIKTPAKKFRKTILEQNIGRIVINDHLATNFSIKKNKEDTFIIRRIISNEETNMETETTAQAQADPTIQETVQQLEENSITLSEQSDQLQAISAIDDLFKKTVAKPQVYWAAVNINKN